MEVETCPNVVKSAGKKKRVSCAAGVAGEYASKTSDKDDGSAQLVKQTRRWGPGDSGAPFP
jgi:hypothetical protein